MNAARKFSLTVFLALLLAAVTALATVRYNRAIPPPHQITCHNFQAQPDASVVVCGQGEACAGEIGLRQIAADL